MSSEKTEQATPKRRSESRKRGEVPRSVELSGAVALLSVTVFFRWYGPYLVENISMVMRGTFSDLRQPDFTPAAIQVLFRDMGMTFAKVLAPLFGVVILVAFVTNIGQGGFVVSMQAIKPQFSRVNPASGIKRILSKRGAFDTAKSILKLVVIGAVAYPVLRENIEVFATLTGSDPGMVGRTLASAMSSLALRASVAFFILAVMDYGYQRWEHEQKMKMTLQEVKEEMRNSEGNPEIKARVRRIQRQMARGRMLQDVPSATVVVTNPTHIAIAIKFDFQTMTAPLVVAKGTGQVAERIKQTAREHGVLVMENKPLARALYKLANVGGEIPVDLYEAVADVIAYVYRLRTRR